MSSDDRDAPDPVITPDPSYVGGIRIYNTGIMEDPVPGQKAGKGIQALNSSYWLGDLAAFIAAQLPVMRHFVRTARALAPPGDFRYFINTSNQLFMKAENEGLRTEDARDYWLMASWLAMAAAEVDAFGFSKYTPEQRRAARERFYAAYLEPDVPLGQGSPDRLGKYFTPPARVDLIPPIALERLGIHNELCKLKMGANATAWKTDGFPLSKRISSAKRHFDGVHHSDHSEDHVAHLVWNFMAIYHVWIVHPELNDLPNYEGIRAAKGTPAGR